MFKNKMSLRLRIFISMIFLVFTATLLILGSTYYQYRTESDQYNSYRQERKENQLLSDLARFHALHFLKSFVFFIIQSFLFISLYPIDLLVCQQACALARLLLRLRACAFASLIFPGAGSSNRAPRPGRCGPGQQVYESRMSSMIFKFLSVASTQKTASPAMLVQSLQSAVSWSSIAFMNQKRI